MISFFLHATSFTELNKIKKKSGEKKKKDQAEVNICSDRQRRYQKHIIHHFSFLRLPWLPSGKLMSELMEFCPRSLLCWGSCSLCCFSQGPHELSQNWMMQKNSKRNLQGNRGSNSIELSGHYFIACLNTWGFYRYKFDSRPCLKNIY